ncbi:hypothetical protein [Streptomyces sp. WAC06614]|uniref:hypothetical protein n=1 Tax=Streptomyces sp. WAC06614 TaxID=2487416 RepID=UPI000F79136F|nr:hypothetical protein [Streptomyces sp. WAC06614]RSS81838.1 hypothetical protein EF918_08900 [Streptomyces sp. WAC06614]
MSAVGMLAGAAAVAALMSAPAASASPGDDKPVSLLGTWTGERQVISSANGFFEGPVSLQVTEQQDRTFKGLTRYVTSGGVRVEKTVVGAFTPHRSVMAGSNDEGVYTFELVHRDVLEYCYTEHGGDASVTSCGKLVRNHR